jgi:hypothetical protein
MENEGEEVKIDDAVETLGKVVEKRGEIALLGDGLADFEQGFELTPGVFERGRERHFRRRNDGVRHTSQDNTRVGAGSTEGGGEVGCLSFHTLRSMWDQRLSYIHSRWVDEAAFQVHAKLPHTVRFLERVDALLDQQFALPPNNGSKDPPPQKKLRAAGVSPSTGSG